MSGKKKRIGIARVAKEAGVSATTASFVLNGHGKKYNIAEKTIQRVQSVAETLGYVADYNAHVLKEGSARLIAFLAPYVTEGVFDPAAFGFEDEARARHYSILMGNTRAEEALEKQYVENFVSRRVDGVIIAPIDPALPHFQLLKKNEIPTVIFGERTKGAPDFSFIRFDEVKAAELAVDHLVSKGARKIGFLEWKNNWADPRVERLVKLRLTGYKNALKRAGIRFSSKLVHPMVTTEPGHQQRFVDYYNASRPEALVAMRDVQLISLLRTFDLMNISIPEDLMLVGCGNQKVTADLNTSLTTIQIPMREAGIALAKCLFRQIEKPGARSEDHLLPVTLVERESTGG